MWDINKKWFLSKFLVFHLFSSQVKEEYSENPLDIQSIIEIGLSKLDDAHFLERDVRGKPITRYQNSIGSFIGWNIASIKSVFISPQHILPKHNPSASGASPNVDFYVNGNVDCYLEIVRDSSLIENHFQKFEEGVAYALRKGKNYVVLDINLSGSKPSEIAEKYKSRLYTFVRSRNALFHGDKQIKSNVSSFLRNHNYRQFSTMPSSSFIRQSRSISVVRLVTRSII